MARLASLTLSCKISSIVSGAEEIIDVLRIFFFISRFIYILCCTTKKKKNERWAGERDLVIAKSLILVIARNCLSLSLFLSFEIVSSRRVIYIMWSRTMTTYYSFISRVTRCIRHSQGGNARSGTQSRVVFTVHGANRRLVNGFVSINWCPAKLRRSRTSYRVRSSPKYGLLRGWNSSASVAIVRTISRVSSCPRSFSTRKSLHKLWLYEEKKYLSSPQTPAVVRAKQRLLSKGTNKFLSRHVETNGKLIKNSP